MSWLRAMPAGCLTYSHMPAHNCSRGCALGALVCSLHTCQPCLFRSLPVSTLPACFICCLCHPCLPVSFAACVNPACLFHSLLLGIPMPLHALPVHSVRRPAAQVHSRCRWVRRHIQSMPYCPNTCSQPLLPLLWHAWPALAALPRSNRSCSCPACGPVFPAAVAPNQPRTAAPLAPPCRRQRSCC